VTYYDAAIKVLESAQHPLTSQEITDLAVNQKLIEPRTKTPYDSMRAALYVHGRDDPRLIKLEDTGTLRAKKNSVRWILRQDLAQGSM